MMYRMNLTTSSSHLYCRKVGIHWTDWNKTFYRHSCSPTDIGWLDIKLDIHGSQMMYRITQIYWLKVIYFTFNYLREYVCICSLDWHKIVYRYSCSLEDKSQWLWWSPDIFSSATMRFSFFVKYIRTVGYTGMTNIQLAFKVVRGWTHQSFDNIMKTRHKHITWRAMNDFGDIF